MNIGKVSGNVLKRSVLRQLKTGKEETVNGAGIGEDCAVFSFADGLVTCTHEAAVTAQAQDGCDLSDEAVRYTASMLVQKCANDLAAAGARPAAVTVTLLLPESAEESVLKALMRETDEKCRQMSMAVAGARSRVMRELSAPVAVIAGFGVLPEGEDPAAHTVRAAAPGQDVVLSKWIGLEGTALLAQGCRDRLLSRYPAYLVEEAAGFSDFLSVVPEAATAVKSGVCAMHNASEGGILAALWELAEGAGVGLTIDLRKLPLRQETVEICEYCGINPYELLSGGCLIMTAKDGSALAADLNARGIPAAVVGKVTDSNDRILMNEEEVRYLDRPKTDELIKFVMPQLRRKERKI